MTSDRQRVELLIGRIGEDFELDTDQARTKLHKFVCSGSCGWFRSRKPPQRFKLDLTEAESEHISGLVDDVLPGMDDEVARKLIHGVICHPI